MCILLPKDPLFVDAAERVLNRELLVRVERTRLFDSAFREFK